MSPYRRLSLYFIIGIRFVVSKATFISLGDRQFEGEDPVLASALARRMAAPRALNLTIDYAPNHPFVQILDQPTKPLRSRRNQYYENEEPGDESFYLGIMKMQETALFAAQYRFKEMSAIVQRYVSDPRFRMSYIMCKLDEWKIDMNICYTYSKKHSNSNYEYPIYLHMVYYTHCLRKHIDITYTIEYLLDLHEMVLEKLRTIFSDLDRRNRENSAETTTGQPTRKQ